MHRNAPRAAAVFGVDLGKNLFHVVGLDERGAVVQRVKFRRDTVLALLSRASPSLVGMDACPGSQWLARKLQVMGHSARIVPAQFVKPFVKSQKNDIIDAEAIAEAVTRQTMCFTQVRTTEQIDLGVAPDQGLPGQQPHTPGQPGAGLLASSMGWRSGRARIFRSDLPRVLADDTNDLTPAMRVMLSELFENVERVDQRIASVMRQIEALAEREDRARRLTTIPGIGPWAATALLAAVGDGHQFRRARELAAWLGLTPREHSTGGKTTLREISERSNRYVRKLLVHRARSCVTHLNRTRDRIGQWLDALQGRMHVNKVTVALAAKIARMAWATITRPGAIYERKDPAIA